MHFVLRLLIAPALLAATMGLANAQTPTFNRAVACGSAELPYGWAPRVATDAQGNTYAMGLFNGTTVFGNTILTAAGASPAPGLAAPADVFVAKLDATGNYLWAAQAGGLLDDAGTSLAVDGAGNVYVAGYFESYRLDFGTGGLALFNSSARKEGYVAKLNGTTGQWQWARRCGGGNHDAIDAVAVNTTGEVYIAGEFSSILADFGSFSLPNTGSNTSSSNSFVAKLDAAGTWLWVRPVGNEYTLLNNLTLDGQSAIYLAGNFGPSSVSFGTTTLTTQPVASDPSRGNDVFIAKMTDAGTWLWATQGAPNGHNVIGIGENGLTYDGAGNLYVVGNYGSWGTSIGATTLPNLSSVIVLNPLPPLGVIPYGTDVYVARLDAATGSWQWAVRAGGQQSDGIGHVVADGQRRVFVAGGYYGFENPLPGGGQTQLAELDGATGAWRWTLPVTGTTVLALALDGAGQLMVGGLFRGATATFNALTLAQAGPGLSTGFVAHLVAGPLAGRVATPGAAALAVWPNPGGRGPVWVQGPPPGAAVQVLDALGRAVWQGQMPATGPLALALPAGLPAGLYLVRGDGQTRRLVVE